MLHVFFYKNWGGGGNYLCLLSNHLKYIQPVVDTLGKMVLSGSYVSLEIQCFILHMV